MKLVDLIKIIKDYNDLEEITCNLFLNSETEVNLVYMERQIDFDSEICFFTLEETDDNLFFKKENILYVQLFPLPDLTQIPY